MNVCIGGTFNILHKGHKLLIQKAFEIAGKNGSVFIGLSTGELLKKKNDIKSFGERRKTIEKYLHEKGFTIQVEIRSIKDKYGPSISRDFDAIIVSPETKKTAEEINRKRIQNGNKFLEIVEIPFVLAKDGKNISSTRIKNKEIDAEGNIL